MPIGRNSFGHFWQLCAELEVAGRDVRGGAGRRLERGRSDDGDNYDHCDDDDEAEAEAEVVVHVGGG